MRAALIDIAQAGESHERGGFAVVVVRALPAGVFEIDYASPTRMPRAHVRAVLERMQDEFDAVCAPLRAYLFRDGIPIEAAHGLRSHRS